MRKQKRILKKETIIISGSTMELIVLMRKINENFKVNDGDIDNSQWNDRFFNRYSIDNQNHIIIIYDKLNCVHHAIFINYDGENKGRILTVSEFKKEYSL